MKRRSAPSTRSGSGAVSLSSSSPRITATNSVALAGSGTRLIVGFGCALLPIGAVLWRLSRAPVAPRLSLQLGAANLTTYAAALTWRLAATGFSAAGSALTISAAAALALLAAAQLRSLSVSRPA